MKAEEIKLLLARCRFRHTSEEDLQEALGRLFSTSGVPFEREVRLNPRDRIDFLLEGGIGLEVKIKGSAASTASQMRRYSASERVTALILVTDRVQASGLPPTLGGKHVFVVTPLSGLL